MANVEVSNDVLDRLEAEAARRRLTTTEVLAELAGRLPAGRPKLKTMFQRLSVQALRLTASLTESMSFLRMDSVATDGAHCRHRDSRRGR